jgi:hypothetical protein
MFDSSLFVSLRRPRDQIRAFDAARPAFTQLPYKTWSWLAAIAVSGSGLYGASLSLVLPGWSTADGALWLILSAGLGWCIFGPALILVTGRNIFTVTHACLVTMAYGEAVLIGGAIINLVQYFINISIDPFIFNFACVGLANLVMAATLTLQFRAVDVPGWKTLLVWMAILNGSGVVFFTLFRRLLQGGN